MAVNMTVYIDIYLHKEPGKKAPFLLSAGINICKTSMLIV